MRRSCADRARDPQLARATATARTPAALAAQISARLRPHLNPAHPTAAIVAASPGAAEAVARALARDVDAVVGYGAAPDAFVEDAGADALSDDAPPALRATATLLQLPRGAATTAFHAGPGCLPSLPPGGWEAFVAAPPALVLFAAAADCAGKRAALDAWLDRVDVVLPGAPTVGGVVAGPVVAAGGKGRPFAAHAGGVVGLSLPRDLVRVVVAPGSSPLTREAPLVTASLPLPRGDAAGGTLVTALDGRRVCGRALGLDDGVDCDPASAPKLVAELSTGGTFPATVAHRAVAIRCAPGAVEPGVTRLRLRAVGDRDARERTILAAAAPARRSVDEAAAALLEFSGLAAAPGAPSLVARALGAHDLGATFSAAIAGAEVHDQCTVLAYVGGGRAAEPL